MWYKGADGTMLNPIFWKKVQGKNSLKLTDTCISQGPITQWNLKHPQAAGYYIYDAVIQFYGLPGASEVISSSQYFP